MTEPERPGPKGSRSKPAWYCAGCGTPKHDPRPGTPCPAKGCGWRVTTSNPETRLRG